MEAAENSGATNVCFTGGEPFLQKPEDLRTIAQLLHAQGMTLEVFTNGTLEWPDWAIYTFKFVMDWKLIGSGETLDPLGPVMRNATRLSIKDAIKFTCANKDDLNEAYNVWIRHFFGERADLPEFFCGPVWDKMEPVEVVDFILRAKVPWRLNIQAHKYIWPPDERAV
jgi:7-carboxy-7-deazaguanine synthase